MVCTSYVFFVFYVSCFVATVMMVLFVVFLFLCVVLVRLNVFLVLGTFFCLVLSCFSSVTSLCCYLRSVFSGVFLGYFVVVIVIFCKHFVCFCVLCFGVVALLLWVVLVRLLRAFVVRFRSIFCCPRFFLSVSHDFSFLV